MSWEQDYDIEGIDDFLAKILNMSKLEALLRECFNKKIKVEIEPIVVVPADERGYYQEHIGAKITIIRNDKKKVYVPKLVKTFSSNGNYGCDTYRYVEENKKVKVRRITQ